MKQKQKNDLDPNNRRVKLSEFIPWDELANVYSQKLDSNRGHFSIDICNVLAAMIVKHFLKLDDRGTIQMIQDLNRANRKYLNKKHVKIVGKFEQAKRGYKLNNIKARLASTSESWVNTILFVLNLKSIENLSKFYLCKQDELKIKSADPIYIYLFSNDEKINKKII